MRTIIEQKSNYVQCKDWVDAIELDEAFDNGKATLAVNNQGEFGSIDLTRDELIKLRDALAALIESESPKE